MNPTTGLCDSWWPYELWMLLLKM